MNAQAGGPLSGASRPPAKRLLVRSLAALWLAAIASAPACAAESQASDRSQSAAWVELVDGGVAEVRFSGAGNVCPELLADGRPIAMSVRAAADPAFPVPVCQAQLPSGTQHAELGGRPIPTPRPAIKRIVVLGDTGCRLKGLLVQNCNDANAWPFAKLAALAAAEHPDLVIDVGDYYYRETACPLNWAGCADSPHGDSWPTWVAEFFEPAKPLLEAAPWVFARGNHESCSRGGKGWFRLLDAADAPRSCPAAAAPFAVPIGGVTLHLLDSADTVDRKAPADGVLRFKSALKTVRPEPRAAEWIVTHRPIWGLVPVARLGPFGALNLPINATEQMAARGEDLSDVQLVLSGHIHHFASFSFGPPRPAQLIVGTGGDVGESADSARVKSDIVEIDGLEAKSLEFEQFGYFILERAGGGWRGAFKDLTGKTLATCVLRARSLSCAKLVNR